MMIVDDALLTFQYFFKVGYMGFFNTQLPSTGFSPVAGS